MTFSTHIENCKNDPNYRYTYVIAEIGVNHNGDIETALKLIEIASIAGADAVKFQLRDLDDIYTKEILDDPNSAEWNFEYIIPILKSTHLNKYELATCMSLAKTLGMDFIITPFDTKSAEICHDELNIDAFKIGSMDMINYELVKKCFDYDKPVIISTGMWTEEEIKESVDRFNNLGGDYVLLLANSTYPTPYEAINLEFLHTLREIHPFVGYSGHERGTFVPVAAAAIGAMVIEKHITFDRNQEGPDHKASMLPKEFKEMVTHLRELEKALGSEKVVNQAEELAKQTFSRAAYTLSDLKKGHVLKMSDLEFKAPGKGILRHQIKDYIGKKLTYDVKKGKYLVPTDFKESIPITAWNLPKFSKHWGVKCRFHDYDEYAKLNSPVIEFHMSETDLDVDFRRVNRNSQLVVHAPEVFGKTLVDICNIDRDVRNRSLELIQRSVDKTLELSKGFKGRPKFVVHLGGMSLDESASKTTGFMMDRAVNTFKKLNFNPDDIEILPENLPPRPWYLGGQWFQYGFMTAEDMIKFCDHFGLKITLDICHAALHCNHDNQSLDGYVNKLLSRTSHFHLSDAIGIDGEGIQIGEGDVNFDSLMKVLKEKEDDFSWVTEIWSAHVNNGEGCMHSMHQLGKFNNII